MSSEQAKALVQKLVEVGEWPEPALLDEIAAQGQDAVEPLLEVVRSQPHGWPAEAALDHAIVLLCLLRPPQAVPALVELLRHYTNETTETVAANAGIFGAEVVEPALAVARADGLSWYSRSAAAELALHAAGDNPDLRSRVAAGLREILAAQIARAPQFTSPAEEEGDEDDEEEHEESEGAMDEVDKDFETEDEDFEMEDEDPEGIEDAGDEDTAEGGNDSEEPSAGSAEDYYQLTSSLVADLSMLADPEARSLIDQAFEADLVDPWMIGKQDVARDYLQGGQPQHQRDPLEALDNYRIEYEKHKAEERRKPLELQQPRPFTPLPVEDEEVYEEPSQQPFINHDRKPGRNEPCWCGSGKKYKQCHMRQDRQ
jgi:hypothetical protein